MHEIRQGEGGEQGDALMPALYALGQAQSLRNAHADLLPGELLIPYLDDLYIVTRPGRARAAYDVVTAAVRRGCGVEANLGKTVCWNRRGGEAPPGIAALGAHVWQGGNQSEDNGIRVLGAPLGTAQFCNRFCADRATENANKYAKQCVYRSRSMLGCCCTTAWFPVPTTCSDKCHRLLHVAAPSSTMAQSRAGFVLTCVSTWRAYRNKFYSKRGFQ